MFLRLNINLKDLSENIYLYSLNLSKKLIMFNLCTGVGRGRGTFIYLFLFLYELARIPIVHKNLTQFKFVLSYSFLSLVRCQFYESYFSSWNL